MAKIIAIGIFSILYSIFYAIFGPMVIKQDFSFSSECILPCVICFVICFLTGNLLLFFLKKYNPKSEEGNLLRWWNRLGDNKVLLLIWLLIFLSWIPAFLLLFPGVLSYDTISQVGSALGTIDSNHHPILHTWLIRVFMKFGMVAFSSYEIGIGLMSLLQMILLSFALAYMVVFLKKQSVPLPFVVGTFVMSSLWFLNSCMAVSIIKDTLFSAFFVLFVCLFTELVRCPKEFCHNKRKLIFFPLITFLMCAFRNNGIHIYVFCIVFLFVLNCAKKEKIKSYLKLLVIMIIPVIVFKLYTGPFFKEIGVEQGQVREALSVPIQQLQRVAVYRWDELSDDQKQKMDYYIDNLLWRDWEPGRKYSPCFADPAKSCFYSEHYNSSPKDFWKFYLSTGGQFTKEYIAAFLSNTVGYWYPGFTNFSYVEIENYDPSVYVEPLERKSLLNSSWLKKYYESVCTSAFWRETPVLRFFFIPSFSIWILLLTLILTWGGKDFISGKLPIFLPFIGTMGIIFLGPMPSFRYSWPFYLILPIFFIVLVAKHPEEEERECS